MKTKYLLLLVLLSSYFLPVRSQYTPAITSPLQKEHFDKAAYQIAQYPQEKLHLHIDKSTYLTTDTIWLRAYLVHATFHTPFPASWYTYIDLITPTHTIAKRIQLKARRRLFYGYIALTDTMPDGDYILRAYTDYMTKTSKDYFFERKIKIVSPAWGNIKMKVTTEENNPKKSQLVFQLERTDSLLSLSHINASLRREKVSVLKQKENQFTLEFKKKRITTDHSFHLRLTDRQGNRYERFLPIATDKEPYDVSFYPEGGYLIEGNSCRVTFKALGISGNSADVSLCIRDETGDSITSSSTLYEGIGVFEFTPKSSKKYYAHCTNRYNMTKTIALPLVRNDHYGLRVEASDSAFHIHLQKPAASVPRGLYLIAHVRGAIVSSRLWIDPEKDIILDKKSFPEGIIQFLLLDSELNALSERLAFSKNYHPGNCRITIDKTQYGHREPLTVNLTVNDSKENPVQGYFSVSVTAAGIIPADTCHSIQSSLLLTSELKGYIPHPALWLADGNEQALDLLMMTHGWRRYSIPSIVRKEYINPPAIPERSMSIEGKAHTLRPFIGGLGKASDQHSLIITGVGNAAGYREIAGTDTTGRFKLEGLDFSENSGFRILARQNKGKTTDSLLIIPKEFPAPYHAFPQTPLVESTFSIADSDGLNGIRRIGYRHYLLREVEIKSPYWGTSNYQTLTEKDAGLTGQMPELLKKLGLNVIIRDDDTYEFFYGDNSTPVVVFLDNYQCDPYDFTWWIHPGDLRELTFVEDADRHYVNEMLKGTREWATLFFGEYEREDLCRQLFGIDRTKNKIPVLNAISKPDFDSRCFGFNSNMYISPQKYGKTQLTVYPLGYQLPVEFYSPQYDTIQKKGSPVPDLRTTLFWKPDVKTDTNGHATFTFYTSDNADKLSIIVEGITDKGEMIHEYITQ